MMAALDPHTSHVICGKSINIPYISIIYGTMFYKHIGQKKEKKIKEIHLRPFTVSPSKFISLNFYQTFYVVINMDKNSSVSQVS